MPYVINKPVIVKQFKLNREKRAFEKELRMLKKIKALKIVQNAGFPLIISAKVSKIYGEIMMSYVGENLFELLNIESSLNDH